MQRDQRPSVPVKQLWQVVRDYSKDVKKLMTFPDNEKTNHPSASVTDSSSHIENSKSKTFLVDRAPRRTPILKVIVNWRALLVPRWTVAARKALSTIKRISKLMSCYTLRSWSTMLVL